LPLSVTALPSLSREGDDADTLTLAPEVVVVQLRNGEKRALRAAVGKVVKMWEAILREQRL
jgi:hypothetical protein